MQKGTNIIQTIHHLKMACDYLQDFQREHPGTNGARLFKNYEGKVRWIFTDLLSQPALTDARIIAGIKEEINSDVFTISAITEKASQLTPTQREVVELIIDKVLAGEVISVEQVEA